MTRLRLALVPLAFILPASLAAAQTHAAAGAWSETLIHGIVGTVIYGVLGIILAVIGMKVFEWVTPYSVDKELAEKNNISVAIAMGAMVLGVSIIIAATIMS